MSFDALASTESHRQNRIDDLLLCGSLGSLLGSISSHFGSSCSLLLLIRSIGTKEGVRSRKTTTNGAIFGCPDGKGRSGNRQPTHHFSTPHKTHSAPNNNLISRHSSTVDNKTNQLETSARAPSRHKTLSKSTSAPLPHSLSESTQSHSL